MCRAVIKTCLKLAILLFTNTHEQTQGFTSIKTCLRSHYVAYSGLQVRIFPLSLSTGITSMCHQTLPFSHNFYNRRWTLLNIYRKAQKFGKQIKKTCNLLRNCLRSEALVFYTGACAERPLVVPLKPSMVNLRTTFKVVFVGGCCCFGFFVVVASFCFDCTCVGAPLLCPVPMEARRGTGSSGTGVSSVREPPSRFWKLNPGFWKSSRSFNH